MSDLRHMQPLVSVIIPLYNMEKYIAETLDSVLASTYPCFEVVVMDDGSRDSSLEIARKYAEEDARLRVYTQPNGGVSAARNHAISLAKGEFILPLDSDNTIEPTFISRAVETVLSDPGIKVVAPTSDFFGERTGLWKLEPFTIKKLARKNMLDAFALYRRSDWERVGGYSPEIRTREDWAFWIAVLKDGGKVVRLPGIEHHYRVRGNSKRVTHRGLKSSVVDTLNRLHPEFFERELGGRLHHNRSWSRFLNCLYRLVHPRRVRLSEEFAQMKWQARALPAYFDFGSGHVIHSGRNELRELQWKGQTVVAKSFKIPNVLNRFVYGILRPSKAQRSMEYARLLRANGIGSPAPVAYYTERTLLLFSRSFYVCLKSRCGHSYVDLMRGDYPGQEPVLRAIARTAARMHDLGIIHKDFSRGNILFGEAADGGVEVEIIDLNRIRFHKVGIEEGCQNFERLPATPEMLRIIAHEYATARGLDPELCHKLITQHNHAVI